MALYNNYFYHGLLRKYTIAFGTLFNHIYVVRDDDDVEQHRERVPLTYAPKEKFIYRIKQDSGLDRKVAIKLPRMAFDIVGLAYSPERKITSQRKIGVSNPDDPDQKYWVYNPIPYDINFSLSIAVKTQTEGLQIVEQIIPFFAPEYVLTMKGVENPDVKFDTAINLISVGPDDTYQGSFEEDRSIIWNMEFVMKAYFFGPARSSDIIKTAETYITNYEDFSNHLAKITVEPFISGTALSDIEEDDPWSVSKTIEEDVFTDTL